MKGELKQPRPGRVGKILGCVIGLVLASEVLAFAYPLDGYSVTQIARLEGLRLAQQGKVRGPKRVEGALWSLDAVDIRLTHKPGFTLPANDTGLAKKLGDLLGEDAPLYQVALLDLSDEKRPRYAALRGDTRANPGSVGKIGVALAVFQALADQYPDDLEKRRQMLKTIHIEADPFIGYDHHKVPFFDKAKMRLVYRPIRQGDRASLWTFLDWMMSASSNAAAAMVQKEVMLIRYFGEAYPVSKEIGTAYFDSKDRNGLKADFLEAHLSGLVGSGLDPQAFRQGSFFSSYGKKKVPGTTSRASAEGLIRFLLKLEQGLLIDPFSSREIKRLLYMTGRRIRYASAPALNRAGVYFKSGSLYKCKEEPGFICKKYQGNVLNQLASVAIVEQKDDLPRLHYLVAVMSNVLYKNSAVAHQTLATRIHRLLEKEHRQTGAKEQITKK